MSALDLASRFRMIIGLSVTAFFAFSLEAAAPHYFLTTIAGYTPPAFTPIALQQPQDAYIVAYDPTSVLYYADPHHIWRLNADGTDTLVAGSYSTQATYADGKPAVDVPLNIFDFQFDLQKDIFIADERGNKIYKITPDGVISTFAGTGAYNPNVPPIAGQSIPATSVLINPGSLAIDPNGNVYTDTYVNRGKTKYSSAVVSFSADGSSSKLISTSVLCYAQGRSMAVSGQYLFVMASNPGIGSNTSSVINLQTLAVTEPPFIGSPAIAVAPDGSVYFYKGGIYKVDPQTLTGEVVLSAPGLGLWAMSVNPVTGDFAVTGGVNPHEGLPASDLGQVSILSTQGKLQIVACNAPAISGDNGPASLAALGTPDSLATDSQGNLYVSTATQIRKISPSGIITTIAGAGTSNAGQVGIPGAMAVDAAGDVYFLNWDFNSFTTTIRKLSGGIITTVAGNGTAKLAAGAMGTQVSISSDYLALDAAGNLYFDGTRQVFKMSPSGDISLVAGTGTYGTIINGAAAASAPLGAIYSIAVDNSGVVYIGDAGHGLVLKVDSQSVIHIVAGAISDKVDYPVMAGPAVNANLGAPTAILTDSEGNVIFAVGIDSAHPQILMVDPSGNLTPIAGDFSLSGSVGDGVDSTLGSFSNINGLAIDPNGHIYINDSQSLIREMAVFNPQEPPPFITFGGVIGAGENSPAVQAVSPGGLVSIFGGNFASAANQHTVKSSDLVNGKLPTMLEGVCVNFGSLPAAITGVYQNQINVQVGAVPPGGVNVQVTLNCGGANPVVTNATGVMVQTSTPEFFSYQPDPIGGHNPVTALDAKTGAYIGPIGLLPGVTFAPAKPGEVVEVFATGLGATTPSYGLGVLPGAAGNLSLPWSLELGGVQVPAGNILYAGVAPCCAGLYQVDFTVPQGTPTGNNTLVITVAGLPSPQEAYLAVQ